MKQYVFPVIFFKETDGSFTAFAPDLELTSEGETIERTFLYIQDLITVYCGYVTKMGEEETLIPTKYEKIQSQHPNAITLLVDAFVK